MKYSLSSFVLLFTCLLLLQTNPTFAESFIGPLEVGTTAITTISGDSSLSSFSGGIDVAPGNCFSVGGTCLPYSFITVGNDIVIKNNAGGIDEMVIGNTAFDSFSSGMGNTSIGHQSLNHMTDGSWNVALGRAAGYAFGSGHGNTFLGTGIGESAAGLGGSWSGDGNTFIGNGAADTIGNGSTLSNNTIIGFQAADGQTLGNGTYNILIGANTKLPLDTGDYQMNVGNILYGTNISGVGYSVSPGKVGVGTANPSARLTVQANNGEANSALFSIASSSSTGTDTLYTINNVGHVVYGGTNPTVTSCGGGASVSGNDSRGRITTTTGVGSSCVLVFAHPWANPPVCFANQETGSPRTITTLATKTTVTLKAPNGIGNATLTYSCDGY